MGLLVWTVVAYRRAVDATADDAIEADAPVAPMKIERASLCRIADDEAGR